MAGLYWLLGLGCSAPVDPVGAQLPPPWGALALPIGQGEVQETTATTLHVAYPGGSGGTVEVVARAFDARLEAAGWRGQPPEPLPIGFGVAYTRGEQELDLLVTGKGQRVDVLLEVR